MFDAAPLETFEKFEYPWLAALTVVGVLGWAGALAVTVVAVVLSGLGVAGVTGAVAPAVGVLVVFGGGVFALVTLLLFGILVWRFYRGKPTLSAIVRTGSDDENGDE